MVAMKGEIAEDVVFLKIRLSEWLPWVKHGTRPSMPGVYVIARDQPGNGPKVMHDMHILDFCSRLEQSP
ncbi:hypothetical protein ABUE31_00815 [Mesorhizobium sp. ZMM04-5]|uniref:Uncharacterized protein n=1 Tax=Mesorhizobium marinum TaxID=3228790 RepID=A0ABV3QTX3_9HYPH